MFQNNWVAEQLTHEHQRHLMDKAEQARQVRDAQKSMMHRKQNRLLDKLWSEMTKV